MKETTYTEKAIVSIKLNSVYLYSPFNKGYCHKAALQKPGFTFKI